ncbi:hypothetical protein FRC03_003531 [Tulasnella sp. 419]|nr:hypothetical protein FRC03_003531 [Tulasnella sp. 419]
MSSTNTKYRWTSAKVYELLTEVEDDENRIILLGKKDPKDKTSGESKSAAYRRIGAAIFGEEYNVAQASDDAKERKAVELMLTNRVKAKWENLIKEYKVQAARMTVTGGGLGEITENQADNILQASNFSDLHVSPDGPDETTSVEARNLWHDIHRKFEFFGRLHNLLGERPNMRPITIRTGTGPSGAQLVSHPQPVSPISPQASPPITTKEDGGATSSSTTSTPKAGKAPPKPSNLSDIKTIKQAAARKSQKRGFEDTLIDMQRNFAETRNQQNTEKVYLSKRQLLLDEFKLGIYTKEEYCKLKAELDAERMAESHAPKKLRYAKAGPTVLDDDINGSELDGSDLHDSSEDD